MHIAALVCMGMLVAIEIPIFVLFSVSDIPEVPSDEMEAAVKRHYHQAASVAGVSEGREEEGGKEEEGEEEEEEEEGASATTANVIIDDIKVEPSPTLWQLQQMREIIIVQFMVFTLSFAGAGESVACSLT